MLNRMHMQRLQVVELAEQLLGAEASEFLPDFGDIEIEDIPVIGRKIAFTYCKFSWTVGNAFV